MGNSTMVPVTMKPYVFGDTAYIVLDGELDLSRTQEIAAVLPSPDSLSGAVINLARASYVDSSVMATLVRFRRKFIAHGGDSAKLIVLLPKSGEARRAFELAGMTALFTIAYVQPSPVPAEEYLGKPPRF